MKKLLYLVLLLPLMGCKTEEPKPSPPPVVTEHMGPGVVRTIEYWKNQDETRSHSRLVIETQDHKIKQWDNICGNSRISAWQGLVFKDMVFQINRDWDCLNIIEFQR